MATNAFIVHKGNLDGDEELTGNLGLSEGTRLFVVSHSEEEILLRRERQPRQSDLSPSEVMQIWESLRGAFPPKIEWTAEWQAKAEERKRKAAENLGRVHADPSASATDIKSAEREWELADDELDFGPFPER